MGVVTKTWILRQQSVLIVLYLTAAGAFYLLKGGHLSPISQQEATILIGM